jgi:hypothetical protein
MVGSPSLAAAVAQELKDAHAQVLLPLLRRLQDLANQIDADVTVPQDVVRTGFALWARYLTEFRTMAIARLLNSLSAANGPGECARRLRDLREEEPVEHARMPNLERLLKVSASGQFGGRSMFLGTLQNSIEASRAWARYEEEYASQCLLPTPSAEVAASVAQSLDQLREVRVQLAREVQAYVADAPVPVPVSVQV